MAELPGPVAFDVAEENGALSITTTALRITIHFVPFGINVATASGASVLRTPSATFADRAPPAPPAGYDDPAARYRGITFGVDGALFGSYAATGRRRRWYGLVAVQRWTRDGRRVGLDVTTDDPRPRLAHVDVELLEAAVLRLSVKLDRTDGVFEVGWAALLGEQEGCFGLGERFVRANQRGHAVVNWTEDSPFDPQSGHDWTYWPVPFFLSSRGYGMLLDTSRRAIFRLGSDRPDAWAATVDDVRLNAVIFFGPSPQDVIQRYTALTGRPPLPPLWGLGVWKTALGGTEAVREEAQRLRREDLGVSALWVYDQLEPATNSGWGSGMGYPTGDYPDMPALVHDLHAQGYRVLGYVNPQFVSDRPAFAEGVAHGYFLRRSDGSTYLLRGVGPDSERGSRPANVALYDPTNPAAIHWWQGMLRRLLRETGYDGWMHDFGELTPADAVFADGRTGWDARNRYPVLYQQTAAQVCRANKPDAVLFMRSGYTGSQQWAPAAWPGDQHCDWSPDRGLPGVIPAGLSLGICGVNAWGPDIGGFFDASDGSASARSKELWIRWCQFGALTPIMRDHLGTKRLTMPDAVDLWTNAQTVTIWRRFARLHNALLPYLYAYAQVAHETGVPTMRHLVLSWPDDPEALRQDHEYLLGEHLLVAPVVEEGATNCRVYFPPGEWYSFWDDSVYRGPEYRVVPAPLEQIPLFVRGPSILPLLAEPVVTLATMAPEELLASLQLRLYPARDGAPDGRFRFHDATEVHCQATPDGWRITLPASPSRRYLLRLPAGLDVQSIQAQGHYLLEGTTDGNKPGWWRDPSDRACWIRLQTGTLDVQVRARLEED